MGEDGEGTITASNTATATNDIVFSETVGTTSVALGTLTQTDGNIQFAKDVNIKTITGSAGDNMDFNGNVTAETAITFNSGAVTAVGDITSRFC